MRAAPLRRDGGDGAAPSPWALLHALAVEQYGAFALAQGVGLGIPGRTLRDRLDRDGFPRPLTGVALLPGTGFTGHARAFAAALAVGSYAVLTGQPALAAHGLIAATGTRPDLVCPADRRPTPPSGVRLVRSRTLTADHWQLVGEVRVATPVRAFLDLAARCSRQRLRSLLIDARQQRLIDIPRLAAVVDGLPRLHGRARLLAACGDVLGSGADSPLVVEVEGWLRGEGFRLDVPPRTVRTATRTLHPDVTLADLPIAIEVDGFGYHADRRALDLDQRKHNAYLVAGWVVLRITWDRLRDDPEGFLAELWAAVAQVGVR